MNISEILKLKYPNLNFLHDVKLSEDDSGHISIKEWCLPCPIPTQQDLDAWAVEFDLAYRQQQAVQERVYPSIGDQLDMIYKDMKSNTQNWINTIDAIKSAHPKPTE